MEHNFIIPWKKEVEYISNENDIDSVFTAPEDGLYVFSSDDKEELIYAFSSIIFDNQKEFIEKNTRSPKLIFTAPHSGLHRIAINGYSLKVRLLKGEVYATY